MEAPHYWPFLRDFHHKGPTMRKRFHIMTSSFDCVWPWRNQVPPPVMDTCRGLTGTEKLPLFTWFPLPVHCIYWRKFRQNHFRSRGPVDDKRAWPVMAYFIVLTHIYTIQYQWIHLGRWTPAEFKTSGKMHLYINKIIPVPCHNLLMSLLKFLAPNIRTTWCWGN